MTSQASMAVPDEWKDPRQVLPHVAGELREWIATSRGIEHDLQVVLGGVAPDGETVGRRSVHEWLTNIHARLGQLNHDVASKAAVWDLVAQELQRSDAGTAK